MIGIQLEVDITLDITLPPERGPILAQRDMLLSISQPPIAWCSTNSELLFVAMNQFNSDSLVPLQVYLSLKDGQRPPENELLHLQRMSLMGHYFNPSGDLNMDDYFFQHVRKIYLRSLCQVPEASPSSTTTHTLHYQQDSVLLATGADVTILFLSSTRQAVSLELTRICVFSLKVTCRHSQEGASSVEVDSELTVELGLLRSYRQGVRQIRVATTPSSQLSSVSAYKDRSYVGLKCGHFLAAVARGAWGGDLMREDWVIRPSLEFTFIWPDV
ncbi:hypothetical protein B0T16DRAFT_171237 [Cercophora newfieldiana]|uniref:Uncharacterized protein n=1 Tax=Cercophora newfieldiana TaxID=92897 RepID=A0AA39Y6Q5_9PEZI|nr:hypothetical protein B0T16DRAFT_171237 [Cercophora newfieldiana]